ncbi:WG repeat-containing protein [Moraxella bovis]|uniref:KWG Leptospira n=1 Tax=Moraxella bovis TaxID=476 RepID=A0A378Q2F4_MORBO|nr:WG repeat-containing protein [Moraxella bovis]STY93307.1 KWG Leptospira [Moraxella bovis]
MKKYLVTALLLGSLTPPAYACALPKSHYKNVNCTARSGVFLAVKDNGSPVALLNKKGNKTADLFAYDAVLGSELRSGLLPALKNGKVGYINDKGKTIIAFNYDRMNGNQWARGVRGERIIVKQNRGFGVLDTRGKVIVRPERAISHISDFSQGLATVTAGGSTYTIDKNGNRTQQAPDPSPTPELTPAQSSLPNPSTHLTLTPRQQDGKWGFVDDKGVPMIIYAFDDVRAYSENLAGVRMGDNWGFIDKSGQLVIDFRFHKDGFILDSPKNPELPEPLMFKNGKAWIGNLNNGDKLCINSQGVNVAC